MNQFQTEHIRQIYRNDFFIIISQVKIKSFFGYFFFYYTWQYANPKNIVSRLRSRYIRSTGNVTPNCGQSVAEWCRSMLFPVRGPGDYYFAHTILLYRSVLHLQPPYRREVLEITCFKIQIVRPFRSALYLYEHSRIWVVWK